MSSIDDTQKTSGSSNSCSLEAEQQQSSLPSFPLKEFSDASLTESDELLELGSDSSNSSCSRSLKRGSSISHSSTNTSDDDENIQVSLNRRTRKNRSTNGKHTLTKRTKSKVNSKKRTSSSNRKRRRDHNNQSDSSSPIKFHYRHYYKHFHRRAAYGKFSLLRLLRHWVLTMSHFTTKYHKEIFLVIFCIASGLASLRTGPLKTKTVPSPLPLFTHEESSDLLQDFYRGEYVELARKQIPYYPAFILYYAHWDSESIESKKEFLSLAKYFHSTKHGLVKFYAVNCWWPDGQCRQNYKSLSHYPIFVAHAGSTSGVIYNGPIRAEPMIRFVETVLKPFTRIDTEEELWRFRAQHDAILLTSFNSTDVNFDLTYSIYRQMALRNLEADPFSQIGFGILLRRDLGEKFHLNTGNTISLVLFNEIHTAKWILPEKGMKGPIDQVASWVSDRTSIPAITWSYQIRNGFANKVISLGSPDFSKEVLKRPVFLLVTRRYYPSAYSPFYNQIKEVALDYFNCNKSVNVTKLRRMTHKLNSEWMKLWKAISEICRISEKMSPNCQMLWEQFVHWNERKTTFVQESLKNYENVSNSLGFTGFSCNSARPFRFIAVDPVDIPHFAKLALGIYVNPNSMNTTNTNGTFNQSEEKLIGIKDPVAFIIDAQNELILPSTSFNISEIARTIHNFTKEVENRTFNFRPSHFKSTDTESKDMRTKSIRTFTSDQLTEFLESENETPLLLMYSAQFCGFCTVTLAQFVRLAQFLQEYKVNVVLGKIDTYKNSLPQNLTPQTIPTFVFFPAQNRSDSRVLSTGEPITTQLLLKFLLSELEVETRVKMSIQKTSTTEGVRRSKDSITKKIETILQSLIIDPTLGEFHGKATQTNILVDLTPEAVDAWKNELLDHLRSMKVTLDLQ